MSEREFIFIHINKTGGTSIERALKIPVEHRTAFELKNLIGEERWSQIYSFSFVRNPWDKVVSHYHWRLRRNHSNLLTHPIGFRMWVALAYRRRDPRYFDKVRMFMPQLDWITDQKGEILVNRVCRFERLNEDFQDVCAHLGRRCTLPHLKASGRLAYQTYYDEVSRAIVEDLFRKDIEAFGYQF